MVTRPLASTAATDGSNSTSCVNVIGGPVLYQLKVPPGLLTLEDKSIMLLPLHVEGGRVK